MGAAISVLVFLPPHRSPEELETLRRDPNFVQIDRTEGDCSSTFAALHFDRGAPLTILYSHANAEDLLDAREALERMSICLRANVLGYDYEGYGLSKGTCSEAGCSRSARACFTYLLDHGVARRNIVLMGRSLGTGPTVDLASCEFGLAGTVLLSPLLSVLRTRLPEPMVESMKESDMFDNAKKISGITCPVLVIHGLKDRIVPFQHGRELWRRCQNAMRPWWVDGCAHNDVHCHPEFFGKLEEFIKFAQLRSQREWKETVALFAQKMVVKKISAPKLLITAL